MGLSVLILAVGSDVNGIGGIDGYPLLAAEVGNKILIERIIHHCEALEPDRITCIMGAADIDEYHLDSIVRLSSPSVRIIRAGSKTAGAACTSLLAVDDIDNGDELLIVNANNFLFEGMNSEVIHFRDWHQTIGKEPSHADGGIITFDSIHPRYSTVKISSFQISGGRSFDRVTEVSEKTPISRDASVGIYWFRRGADYVMACKEMIRKDAKVDGKFYISKVFNEIILKDGIVIAKNVDRWRYFPIKTSREVLALQRHFESEGNKNARI